MPKDNILSVELIEKDYLGEPDEKVQTNITSSQDTSPDVIMSGDMQVALFTSDILDDKVRFVPTKEHSVTVTFVDTKISSKYPLTLEQARKRALRAIDKSNERKTISLDDED